MPSILQPRIIQCLGVDGSDGHCFSDIFLPYNSHSLLPMVETVEVDFPRGGAEEYKKKLKRILNEDVENSAEGEVCFFR